MFAMSLFGDLVSIYGFVVCIENSLSPTRWRHPLSLSCRLNNNICKPHIGRKIVRDIKWCMVIFFHTIVFDISDLYDDMMILSATLLKIVVGLMSHLGLA